MKPSPIPTPSSADANTPFFDAKASALARMIQLTTINGINIPSDLFSSGANPFIKNSITVTKPAITTMNMGIRTSSGTILRRSEITAFEAINTKVAAIPIPRPLATLVVTARVGHSPMHCTNVGFSASIPLVIILKFP